MTLGQGDAGARASCTAPERHAQWSLSLAEVRLAPALLAGFFPTELALSARLCLKSIL